MTHVVKGHGLISCFEQLVEEKRALEDAERRASEEYIQRLLAEEEERMAEERRRREEQQLENDEKLARLLSQELVSSLSTAGLFLIIIFKNMSKHQSNLTTDVWTV